MNIHEKYIRLAINLAKRAEGFTSPNPIVGACVVKSGAIVGKGYHKRAGLPHAEVNALEEAGDRANGATLYVTLEPCGHFGRTPPCTDAIIKSGIKRVVIAMKDPNPVNNGRGIKRLNRYGIRTSVGILEEKAKAINRPYVKFIKTRMPYVTVKVAQSIDGKIATRTGDSKWITSDTAREYAHSIRERVDAIMVGVNTVLKDDPMLLSGRPQAKRQPARIIVDSNLRTPLDAKLFSTVNLSKVIIVGLRRRSLNKIRRYQKRGASFLTAKSKSGKIDLKYLLRILGERGITHILVEGGGELIAGLVGDGLVDKFLFFIAPKIIGGRDAVTSVEGMGVSRVNKALMLKNLKIRRFGRDVLMEADAK